jgi:hypothetical protein
MASLQATVSELQREVAILRASQPNNSLALKKLIRLEEGRQSPEQTVPDMASALGRINSFNGLTALVPLDSEYVAISAALLRLLIENPFFTTEFVATGLEDMQKPTDEQIHAAAQALPIVYPSLQAARKDLFVLAKNQLIHIMSLEVDAHKGTLQSYLEYVNQCEDRTGDHPRVRVASEGNFSDITCSKIGQFFIPPLT